MTHYRQLYDRDYLGSWDLPENGDKVFTIERCVGGELTGNGGKKNKKPLISFVGNDKKLVCNVTNAKAIAGMYGSHVEKWAGKRITLYVSTTRDPSTGGEIPCIRVRPQAPQDDGAKVSAAPRVTPPPPETPLSEFVGAADLNLEYLRSQFATAGDDAEAAFLRVNKLTKLEDVPESDWPDILVWIDRRKLKRANPQP